MAIKHVSLDSLVTRQNAAEKAMLAELRSGNYTFDNPLVKLNPYLINPYAAVVLFNTPEPIAVTVRVIGKEPEGTMEHTFPRATEHVLPVLGLYAGYDNTVEIELYRGAKHTFTLTTPEMGANVPELVRMETTAGYLRDEIIIVSPALDDFATGYDYKGDVRWHLNIPCVFDMKRVRNGNILIGTDRLLKIPYYMSGIYEMTMAGKIVKEYKIPGGYHHDQFEMPDGNL